MIVPEKMSGMLVLVSVIAFSYNTACNRGSFFLNKFCRRDKKLFVLVSTSSAVASWIFLNTIPNSIPMLVMYA